MLAQLLRVLFLVNVLQHSIARQGNETHPTPAANQLLDFRGSKKASIALTTGWGSPIGDRGNVLTAGPRGPMLIQDVPFTEEMQRFNRERISPRVVHAKGAGAFGYFTVTDDIKRYTKAAIFSNIGKKTPLAARFSLTVGEEGSADTRRDVRGFAVKLHTEEGTWDLVGNHVPVQPIRDPFLFMSFVHANNRNPKTHLYDENMVWDFYSLRPETANFMMYLFSDLGTPDGYRHINGYAIDTFTLVNQKGEPVYCKFRFMTDQGQKNLTAAEALDLAISDPDYAVRDLYNAIATGDFPSWTMYIQVLTPKKAANFPWNIFDPTKTWPRDMVPLIRVGKLVLERNPKNFFADVEQLAFSPGRLVPGIEPTPEKILQSRMFAYPDIQLYRLGSNYLQLPVNSPHHVFNTQRDGEACYTDNQDGQPNYYPSSFINQMNSPRGKILPFTANGIVDRYNSSNEDNIAQARNLWRVTFAEGVKWRLVENIASSLGKAAPFIQQRAIRNFMEIDEGFGHLVQAAVNNRPRSQETHTDEE